MSDLYSRDREAISRAHERWLTPPDDPETIECPKCHGKGELLATGGGGKFSECDDCEGSGQIVPENYEGEYEID